MRHNFVLMITFIIFLMAGTANAAGIFTINNISAKGDGENAKEAKKTGGITREAVYP